MQLLQHNRKTHHVFLLIILVLSAYVHLWKPVAIFKILMKELSVQSKDTLENNSLEDYPFL